MKNNLNLTTFEFINFFKKNGALDVYEDNKTNTIVSAKSGIKIKKANRGKFTEYCGGKVTTECINKGKNSPDPGVRKMATFAKNARSWKHILGGNIDFYKDGNWIEKAINPKHKGYCTPMTKSTCTPKRKALAKRLKKISK